MKPVLIWNTWNKEHITKHQVTVSEVEEAYANAIITQQSYLNRILFIGRTKKKRLLTIICRKHYKKTIM